MSRRSERFDAEISERIVGEHIDDAHAELAWNKIQGRMAETGSPTPARREQPWHTSKTIRLAGGIAMAIAVIAVSFAVAPGGGDDSNFGHLATASAAEVLETAADNASGQASLVPQEGEFFFTQMTRTSEADGSTKTTREWNAPDGSSVVEVESRSQDSEEPSILRVEMPPDVTIHDQTVPAAVLSTNWRQWLVWDQVSTLPGTPDRLLTELRQVFADRLGFGLDSFPTETIHEAGLDVLVLNAIVDVLAAAPLDAGQQTALFELLATSEEWVRSDPEAPLLVIENLGETISQDGRASLMLEFEYDAGRAKVEPYDLYWNWKILLDPETAKLIELRDEYRSNELEVITIDERKLVDERPA